MNVNQAISEALDVAAQEVGVYVQQRWKEASSEILAGSKRAWMLKSYQEAISLWGVEPGTATVTVGLPKQVGSPDANEKIALLAELGADETDMREYMLRDSSEGVKVSKEGARYRVVPIDRSAARSATYLEDAVTGQPINIVRMMKKVLEDAKKLPVDTGPGKGDRAGRLNIHAGMWKNQGANFQSTLRHRLGKEKGTETYAQLSRLKTRHVDIAVERSYYMQAAYAENAVTGKVNRQISGVRSFRTITEDNGGWIRPQMSPSNIWSVVAADIDVDVALLAQAAFSKALEERLT